MFSFFTKFNNIFKKWHFPLSSIYHGLKHDSNKYRIAQRLIISNLLLNIPKYNHYHKFKNSIILPNIYMFSGLIPILIASKRKISDGQCMY